MAENQRQQSLGSLLGQLDAHIQGEKQASQEQAAQYAAQQQAQVLQGMYEKAWSELQKDGIDRPRLQNIYGAVGKHYGFSEQELGNVYDHRLVRMMKDAAAYRALQQQKGAVTQRVQGTQGAQASPRIQPRNNQGAQERSKDQALAAKFKSGRAKLSDLAAYLA